jgi:uncharacterized phage protein (TIGR01671 family)
MSKEIKFKYIWSNPEKTNFITEIFTLDEIEAGNQFTVLENEPLLKDYKLIARVQFTGLHDKNWKEIFEGDIVRFWANPKDYGGYKGHDYIASVEWDEFSVGFILSDGHGLRDFEFLQVVGNIYQNPELLGGEND